MVIVSEWQIVSNDKFHEMPPGRAFGILKTEGGGLGAERRKITKFGTYVELFSQ